MKKILIIHHSGLIGGAGLSLLHIIRSINKDKFKVIVLCPSCPSEFADILIKEDCEVVLSDSSPAIFNHYNGGITCAFSVRTFINLIKIIKDRKNIARYLEKINPDVVAVNSMTLFWIGKIAKYMNKKTICFHRETYQQGILGLRSKIIKVGLSKWFDKVVFISNNDLIETGNIRSTKQVIYDRVEVESYDLYVKEEARNILKLDPKTKYILYLGGMSSLKGAHVILEAMKYVNNNVKLIFINNNDNIKKSSLSDCEGISGFIKFILKNGIKEKVSKIYYDNELQEKVIFMKRTSKPELLFKACDLVVFPSTKPHQSRPIYEAGASKIPILITEFKETKEFAQDNVTAVTFKCMDSKNMADKINAIFDGHIDVNRIVNNNYIQTINHHSLDSLEKDIEILFDFD